MHNWEHYGRLPAYFLAATLVASCGDGGGDGILGNITGVSDAQVTLTAASGSKLTKQGEMTVQVRLLDASSNPLANKSLTLSSSSSNVVLSPTTVVTSATGLATFVIKGNITGELTAANSSGQVTATYTDEKGDIKTHKIAYTIVDVSELVSSYKLDACFVLTANPCASSVTLKTVGSESLADAQFILKDSAGQPLANKKVNFSLLKPTGSGSLQATSATTDGNGKVTVKVQAGSEASSNSIIASVSDANGAQTTSALSFDTIVGNKVTFVADKTDLLSGGDSVDLNALVVSASGNVQGAVPVRFSLVNPSELGVFLKSPDLVTNSDGKAKVTLEITNAKGADLSNHIIQVRASIGAGSDYWEEVINLNVVGTSIEVTTANSSVKIGAKPTITAVLKNGKGQSVATQKLTFKSDEIKDETTGTFLNKEIPTDSTGKIVLSSLLVDKSTDGKAKVNVSGLGTNTVLEFDVSERNFDLSFVNAKNEPVTEIDIREGGSIALVFRDDSTGATLPDSIPVVVTTTLGKIVPPTVLTKVDGSPNLRKATIRLTSDFPGTATVSAIVDDPTTKKQIVATGTVSLVSKIADKLAIQAVTPILAPNGQTNIIAKVRDSNDNPVKGVVVNFELENPLGGTLNTPNVTTNDKGEATVTFTAGSNDTGTEKVQVVAIVPEQYTGFNGSRTQTLNLTVGGEAVFISIGTGNIIQELTSTTYAIPHQITVTDATGAPIANKEIKLSVWPVNYYKGFYVFSEERKLWIAQYTAECSNEDANQNGVLDPWENNKTGNALSHLDYPAGIEVDVEDNGDGKLWPGNPVTLSTSTLTTGADGIAYFNVLYGQNYANWLRVKLTAKAQVSGTESKADRLFSLPASSEDLSNDKASPPGGTVSSFGQASLCSDVN